MTDTSVEALRFRATVRHDGAEVEDLPYLEEFWAVRASDYAALLAERDHYKARAERVEKAGKLLKVAATEIGKDPDCGFAQALNDAIGAWEATLAQIDAAQAALDRLLQEARNEALREAAALVKYEGEEFAGMREGVMFDRLSKKILALITEDQSDE